MELFKAIHLDWFKFEYSFFKFREARTKKIILGAFSLSSLAKWEKCLRFRVLWKYQTVWVLELFFSYDISLHFKILIEKKCTTSVAHLVERSKNFLNFFFKFVKNLKVDLDRRMTEKNNITSFLKLYYFQNNASFVNFLLHFLFRFLFLWLCRKIFTFFFLFWFSWGSSLILGFLCVYVIFFSKRLKITQFIGNDDPFN